MSRTSPSWSTARHKYIRFPAIRTTISSRCHCALGRGRPCRRFRAISGPNLRRTVSQETSSPRSASKFLDVSVAQGEAEIQPDRVLDDLGREAMTAVGERSHLDILSGTPLSRLRFVTTPPGLRATLLPAYRSRS